MLALGLTDSTARREARGALAAAPVKSLNPLLDLPAERFELPTNGLQNRCSTTELSRHRQDRQGGIRALRASARLPHHNGPGRAPACCNRQDAPGEAPERLPKGSFRASPLSAGLAAR